jgi:hypothetical protein
MDRLAEQFFELYKSVPKALSPVDLMKNVRELMKRHGVNSTQAMSMSYAIAVHDPDVEDGTKECLKRFLKPEEVEEAQKHLESLESLEGGSFPSWDAEFKAAYRVELSRSSIFKPDVDPAQYPAEWSAIVREVRFLDGDRYAYNKFKTKLQSGGHSFAGKGETDKEALSDLISKLVEKGLEGKLRVWNMQTNKTTEVPLEREVEPEKEIVPVESDIRRDAVDNGSEYLEALAELDALTGRSPVLAESQRPDIATVIGGMEEDLKKAVLVRLAEMFRGLGYEQWPSDEVGEKDMKNVMEAVSKGLKDMSGRMSELIKGQIEAIRQGPEKYTENLSRWLAGESAIVDEGEEEEGDETDEAKKKSKASKAAQEFISAEISKLVKGGMDQQQAIAAAHSAARDKGMEVPDPKKECGDVAPVPSDDQEPVPEDDPEEVPEREPEPTLESKKAKK